MHKCVLGSDRMTEVLVMFYNLSMKNRCYVKRWEQNLDALLNKGKGMILGKLRTITLIEADLQCIIRLCLNDNEEELIEKRHKNI